MSIFSEGPVLARVPGQGGRGILSMGDIADIVVLACKANAAPDMQIDRTIGGATLVSLFGKGLREISVTGVAPYGCAEAQGIAALIKRAASNGAVSTLTFDGTSYRGIVINIETSASSGNMDGVAVVTVSMLGEVLGGDGGGGSGGGGASGLWGSANAKADASIARNKQLGRDIGKGKASAWGKSTGATASSRADGNQRAMARSSKGSGLI